MKVLVLKDERIADLGGVLSEVEYLYSRNGANLEFIVEERDFSELPWQVYHANKGKEEGPDYGIDKTYIKEQATNVWDKYAYEVDTICFMVHDDSWNDSGDGIWGWNLANGYKSYEIEQIRFDPNNSANTVGTLYHEIAHSHDSFIYRNTGVWIEGIVGIGDWDSDMVHGKADQYKYIQYQENQDAIQAIAPYLNNASSKRREMATERSNMQKRVITLAKEVIRLYRELGIFIKKEDKPFHA